MRIAAELDLVTFTGCAVLARLGLSRLSRLEPSNRYAKSVVTSASAGGTVSRTTVLEFGRRTSIRAQECWRAGF
jgi:hypothetical protein